jgi:hypothetical protein
MQDGLIVESKQCKCTASTAERTVVRYIHTGLQYDVPSAMWHNIYYSTEVCNNFEHISLLVAKVTASH